MFVPYGDYKRIIEVNGWLNEKKNKQAAFQVHKLAQKNGHLRKTVMMYNYDYMLHK